MLLRWLNSELFTQPARKLFGRIGSEWTSAVQGAVPAVSWEIFPMLQSCDRPSLFELLHSIAGVIAQPRKSVASTTRRANHFAQSETRQALPRKIFCFHFSEIHDYLRASASTTRGRIAIVTDVGSGMRWTRAVSHDERCSRRTSEIVWSRSPDAGIKRVGHPFATEANKPGTPRRARISRKPLRRGRRCFGVPVAFSFACEPRVRL
jgi:hypothetical protein